MLIQDTNGLVGEQQVGNIWKEPQTGWYNKIKYRAIEKSLQRDGNEEMDHEIQCSKNIYLEWIANWKNGI